MLITPRPLSIINPASITTVGVLGVCGIVVGVVFVFPVVEDPPPQADKAVATNIATPNIVNFFHF